MIRSLFAVLVVAGFLASPGALAVSPSDVPNKHQQAWDGSSPQSVDGATTIDVEKAHQLWSDRAPFVDVRSNSDWQAGRIPGAVHIVNDPGPAEKNLNQNLTRKALKEVAGKDQPVVFYCNGPGCDRSSVAAGKAVQWGWSEVYYFRAGFPAWKEAGYPVE